MEHRRVLAACALLIVFIAVIEASAADLPPEEVKDEISRVNTRSKRQFGASLHRTYRRHRMDQHRPFRPETSIGTVKTCKGRPNEPVNGELECSRYSGCRATCNDGYQFTSGQEFHMIICDKRGQWFVFESKDNRVPDCVPALSGPAVA